MTIISCLDNLIVLQFFFIVSLPSLIINEIFVVAQSINSCPLISHSPALCKISNVPISLYKRGTASVATENDYVPSTTAFIVICAKNARYPRGIKQSSLFLLHESVFANNITTTDIRL